jgi:hypothetical protein
MKRSLSYALALVLAFDASRALAANDAGVREAGAADAGPADAAAIDASSAGARATDAADAAAWPWKTCTEHLPAGAERPEVTEVLAQSGLSGYAAVLRVKVLHGKGERVFPNGFRIDPTAQAAEELKNAGFALPDQDGGGAARLTFSEKDSARPERASTVVELPVLALPPKPGRQALVLPPLPITVARAGGEITTVCTAPHTIIVEDPIANEVEAMPQPNPPPRPQREEWTALRDGLKFAAIGALVGIAGLLAWRWWSRRPKPVPPPPPPRPPWEIALEELRAIKDAKLFERQMFDEYFDRVNDAVRKYLGARFGFDGLESTSDEILASLRKAQAFDVPMAEVALFLQECDLVKFAKLTPTIEQCEKALLLGESLVRKTMPRLQPAAAAPAPSGPGAPPASAATSATSQEGP